jgi:hypothetical protein
VLITLGTGGKVDRGLVAFHAYGVLSLREEGGERVLEVIDPGSIPISGGLEEGMSGLGLGDRDQDNGMFTLDLI